MVRILLLEDHPLQLQAREAVLEAAGFAVTSANTAKDAFVQLRAVASSGLERFSAVITDHVLAGADGVAFVKKLRMMDPNVPVIVMSGLAEAEPEYDELNVTFLQKPCPPEEFVSALQRVLDR
jgi:DNA-binding NtrC family response regulator